MRKVRAAVLVRETLMVVGSLTALTCAMGKSEVDIDPHVTVTGAHEDMRESEGCMYSWFAAFLNPVGRPSATPMRKTTEAGTLSAEAMLREVVAPADTVTPVTVCTLSSPL